MNNSAYVCIFQPYPYTEQAIAVHKKKGWVLMKSSQRYKYIYYKPNSWWTFSSHKKQLYAVKVLEMFHFSFSGSKEERINKQT